MGIGAKENGNLCHHQEGENRETTEDQRHLNGKKNVRTLALIAAVAAAIEKGHRLSIKALATAHGTSVSTIHAILHDDWALRRSQQDGCPNF
jgi:hypothetical protein